MVNLHVLIVQNKNPQSECYIMLYTPSQREKGLP